MNYEPQPWLADWTAATAIIKEANEMDIDALSSDMDQSEVDEAVDSIMKKKYRYKKKTFTCEDCGAIFELYSNKAKYCPKCKAERKKLWQEEYIQRGKRRADTRLLNAQAETEDKRNTAPVETVLVGSVEASDMKATDVPSVPTDVYYSADDKIKKTSPIETHFGPYKKEDERMDTKREELLKAFPSMSNRILNPDNFTGTDTGNGANIQPLTLAYTPGKETPSPMNKAAFLKLYTTISDAADEAGIPVKDVLDRLTRIDAALS